MSRKLEEAQEELTLLRKQRDEFDDPVAQKMFDIGIREFERRIVDLTAEEREQAEWARAAEAEDSVLGRIIDAAFREVQYDYASTEDYPGLVAAAEKVLTKHGKKIVDA